MIRRISQEIEHVAVPQDEEYLALVRDILENEQVRSMDGYFQHGHTTCLRHSINVQSPVLQNKYIQIYRSSVSACRSVPGATRRLLR